MLKIRLWIGISLLLVSLLIIWWGVIPVTIEVLLIGLLGYYEFYQLSRKKGIQPSLVIGIICITALILEVGLLGSKVFLPFLLLSIFVVLIHFIFRKDFHPNSFFDASVTALGIIYLGGFLSFIILFRQLPGSFLSTPDFVIMRGAAVLAYIILMNSATDVGSFFVGHYLGRHQLCPNISPSKTWEGSLGGLGLALVFAWLGSMILLLPIWKCLGLGLLIGVFAQLGDLWESVIKREVGVKDSGDLLAVHGGLLDRFDSLLFSAPLAFFYWQLFMIGG